MPASYPSAVKTFTSKSDGVDLVSAAHVNDLQDEVVAVEQDILTNGITLSSGKIKFPATQVPSAGANDLDDYEEVDFTPTIVSSGGGTPTYTIQTGSATKIGRKVKAQISVTLATLGTLAAGNISIAGLPYTSRNVANINSVAATQWAGLATNWVNVVAVLVPASTSMLIRGATAAATSNVTSLTLADLGGTAGFVLTIEYDV